MKTLSIVAYSSWSICSLTTFNIRHLYVFEICSAFIDHRFIAGSFIVIPI